MKRKASVDGHAVLNDKTVREGWRASDDDRRLALSFRRAHRLRIGEERLLFAPIRAALCIGRIEINEILRAARLGRDRGFFTDKTIGVGVADEGA